MMVENEKRKVTLLVSMIMVLFAAISIGSYAYFSVNSRLDVNLPVNVVVEEGATADFVATGMDNLSLNVLGEDMLKENAGKVIASASTNIEVAVTSYDAVTCTYDLTWKYNDDSDEYTKTLDYSGNEFSIKVENLTDGTTTELHAPNYSVSSEILNTFTVQTESGKKDEPTTQNIKISLEFYNINKNQDAHAGKTYSGKIALENVICRRTSNLSTSVPLNQFVMELGEPVVTDVHGSYTNYRYADENPDNYVLFNNELWRIIGVFQEDTHGVENKSLVKIIKADLLDNYSFDYKQIGKGTSNSNLGSNDYTDSQLMMMLNPIDVIKSGYLISNEVVYDTSVNIIYQKPGSYYEGSSTGCKPGIVSSTGFTCEETSFDRTFGKAAKTMIQPVKYFLKGTTAASGTVAQMYDAERNGTVSENRADYFEGYIGLMYPSDYGYATTSSTATTRNNCLELNMNNWASNSGCYVDNWLLYPDSRTGVKAEAQSQWTMTQVSDSSDKLFNLNNTGILSTTEAYFTHGVRPVVYLKESVAKYSGDGTSTNPYRLS